MTSAARPSSFARKAHAVPIGPPPTISRSRTSGRSTRESRMTWPSARRIAAVFMDGAGPGAPASTARAPGPLSAVPPPGTPSGTVHSTLPPLPSGRRYIRCISSRFNGRPPRRPNTATWLPLSSTARSRSSPFEIARAGSWVWIRRDQTRRRPRAEAERARRVGWPRPSAARAARSCRRRRSANTLALVIAIFTSSSVVQRAVGVERLVDLSAPRAARRRR